MIVFGEGGLRRWEDSAEKISVRKQQLGMLVSLATGGLGERHSGRNATSGRRPCAAAVMECSAMPSLTRRMWIRQNPAMRSLPLEGAGPNRGQLIQGQRFKGQRGTDLKCHLSPDPSFALALASNGLWPRQRWVPRILWSQRLDDPQSGSVMGGWRDGRWGDVWEVDSWNVEQLEVGVQYQDQDVGAWGCQKEEEDVLLHLWEPGSDAFF